MLYNIMILYKNNVSIYNNFVQRESLDMRHPSRSAAVTVV